MKIQYSLLTIFLIAAPVYATNPPNAYETAIRLFKLGQKDKAFSVAQTLIENRNTLPWGYRLRAELNHEQGRDDLARQDTDKCIQIAIKLFNLDEPATRAPVSHNSNLSAVSAQTKVIDESFAQALSDADKTLLAQKTPKLDLAQIQKQIANNPRDFIAVFKESVAYKQTGDWKSALKAFGKALTLQAKLIR